jgi:hypothetical protein
MNILALMDTPGTYFTAKDQTDSRLILQLNLPALLKNSRLMKIIFPRMSPGNGKGLPELEL